MIQYYSTKNIKELVSLQEAIFRGMPSDNGLYFPNSIPILPKGIMQANLSLQEIAYEISSCFLKDDFDKSEIENIVNKAINFDIPIIQIEEFMLSITELFHGPTAAFKDIGARFMAQLLVAFLEKNQKDITILVATSGDTGGAIGRAFLEIPYIKVVILYPSKKISLIQEKQLTTLGSNVSALEVQGTFDDCQYLVKKAFLDKELYEKLHLTSANSINIARLIPQSFYYAYVSQKIWHATNKKISFSVPSGNLGNLTAGLLAKSFGFPIEYFIGAVNSNRVFTNYLEKGEFLPEKSKQTISNAMDVGNPSNFIRLQCLFEGSLENFRKNIFSFSFSDEETKKAIMEVYKKYDYVVCPHTAVGYLAWKQYSNQYPDTIGNILATAHPAKFSETIEAVIHKKIELPLQLQKAMQKEKHSISVSSDYKDFKDYLLSVK